MAGQETCAGLGAESKHTHTAEPPTPQPPPSPPGSCPKPRGGRRPPTFQPPNSGPQRRGREGDGDLRERRAKGAAPGLLLAPSPGAGAPPRCPALLPGGGHLPRAGSHRHRLQHPGAARRQGASSPRGQAAGGGALSQLPGMGAVILGYF